MAGNGRRRIALLLIATLALAGCEGVPNPFGESAGDGAPAGAGNAAAEVVERDVEAPEVFQVTENGLWDGRPSLGGVWVAYPDVTDPERVIIRNETNGNSVIGALFNRERENPGPKLQVSSDAASALGLLAGQPTMLNVTAMRKEQVVIEPEPVAVAPAGAEVATTAGAGEVEAAALEPLAAAAAAIDKAESEAAAPPAPKMAIGDITPASSSEPLSAGLPQSTAAAPAAAAAATAPPSRPGSALTQPYIQIGIYSVESNARQTGDALRANGVVPTVRRQASSGKTFWRVLVGPANTSAERASLLAKVKDLGYTDAYFVTN